MSFKNALSWVVWNYQVAQLASYTLLGGNYKSYVLRISEDDVGLNVLICWADSVGTKSGQTGSLGI